MKKLLLILCIFNIYIIHCQTIEGVVLDKETRQPVQGVHVYLEGFEEGTLTSTQGRFELNTPSTINAVKIRFSHLAYHPKHMHLNSDDVLTVLLNKKTELLDEVNIVQHKKLNKSISYRKLAKMKNGLHSFGITYNDGKIYIIGGNASYNIDDMKKTLTNYPDIYDINQYMTELYKSSWKKLFNGDLRIYDISSDTWHFTKNKFKDRAHHRISIWNDQLYAIGGLRLTPTGKKEYLQDNIEILHIAKDSSITDYTNPHQAVNFSMTHYKDNLILMGGSIKLKNNGFKEYSNKIHYYNLSTGLWYELGVMPLGKECNSVLVDDKIYIVGGYNRKPLTGIESFDITTQKWKLEGKLFSGMIKPALATNDELIFIFDNGKLSTLNTVTKELQEYYIDLSLVNSEMLYIENKLFIIGGLRVDGLTAVPSSGVYVIDIEEIGNTMIRRSKFI